MLKVQRVRNYYFFSVIVILIIFSKKKKKKAEKIFFENSDVSTSLYLYAEENEQGKPNPIILYSTAPFTSPRPELKSQVEYFPAPKVQKTGIAGVHPNFLQSVIQHHSEWIFGGIAELIDNSVDANAEKLQIFKDSLNDNEILCFLDNGIGMQHDELVRMLNFGHEENGDIDRIGKFGTGFKSGR